MTGKLKFWGGLSLTAVALAACGSSGGVGSVASRFGQTFATAFNAASTADPVQPLTAGSITFGGVAGPDLTADPIEI